MSLEQSNPLVTVYIPTFNRVELLKRAVESVRQQTYSNLEIIIVDDCSKDGTHEYLEEITKQDSRIRYFIKEKNSGACVSRNIAIENANGEFITGLDDDDYFINNRIAIFIQHKKKLNDYIFLCSRYIFKTTYMIKKSKMEYLKPNEIRAKDLLSYNYVGNQIFCKTTDLRKVLFNENLPAWQDLYTWYAMLSLSDNAAFVLKDFSYIVDLSHEHERISNKPSFKIKKAFNIFIEDFCLNKKQQNILFCHLINYGEKNISKTQFFSALLNSFTVYFIFIFIFRVIRK